MGNWAVCQNYQCGKYMDDVQDIRDHFRRCGYLWRCKYCSIELEKESAVRKHKCRDAPSSDDDVDNYTPDHVDNETVVNKGNDDETVVNKRNDDETVVNKKNDDETVVNKGNDDSTVENETNDIQENSNINNSDNNKNTPTVRKRGRPRSTSNKSKEKKERPTKSTSKSDKSKQESSEVCVKIMII